MWTGRLRTGGEIGRVGLRFVLLFVSLLMLTLPFSHRYIPDTGELLRPLFEPLAAWTAVRIFGYPLTFSSPLLSDTAGLYVHLFNLTVISAVAAVGWRLADRGRTDGRRLLSLLVTISAWYLAFHLLEYGFNKVFKWQFYLPEPNTLFTTVGETPRDLLYWSVMGASRPYTMFAGIVEVLAGLLLLFRRTRLAGALLAFGVMVNVVMINFSFDISVKIHSSFLLLLSLIVLSPDAGRLTHVLFGSERRDGERGGEGVEAGRRSIVRLTLKASLIFLIFFDVLSIYVLSGNFNDDLAPRPPLHGAYEVTEFIRGGDTIPPLTTLHDRWRRIFVHRRGYLIVQTMDDRMTDYRLRVDTAERLLMLENPRDGRAIRLYYREKGGAGLVVTGNFHGLSLSITTKKIDLDRLPLLRDEFHWRIDTPEEGEESQ